MKLCGICLQIPAGWMADRFGGKWLFGGCVLLSSVVALFTPAAARIHIVLFIILRVKVSCSQLCPDCSMVGTQVSIFRCKLII